MGKLLNSNKWDKNDIRMLIVMLLITVYPICAGSLFMTFVFFIMPYKTAGIWTHIYWLIATAAWVLLLALILPLLRDNDDKKNDLELQNKNERNHGTKLQNIPIETSSKIKPSTSNVGLEKKEDVQEIKLLPEKNKGMDETTDKECLDELDLSEKSQEIVKRSHGSLNNSNINLRASWGFLNSSLESIEKRKSSEVIHANRNSQNGSDIKDNQQDNINELNESENKIKDQRKDYIFQDASIEDETEMQNMRNKKTNDDWCADEQENIIKEKTSKNKSKDLDANVNINGTFLHTDDPCGAKSTIEKAQIIGIIEPNVKDSEKIVEVNELEELGIEVADLEIVPMKEERVTRSVDRSRASGYIESTVPWSASRTEKNAVFIFVKPGDE